MTKLLTGLFRAARKRLMTTDNDMGMFRQKLDELVAAKDTLSDEEIAAKVEELKGFTKDLPGDDDKAKLDRFLEDFKAVKEQDAATAKEAAGMVANLFEQLDTAAMQNVPAVEPEAEPAAEEPAAGEPLVEEPAADETAETEPEVPGEEPAEEAPAEGEEPAEEAKDADPNPEYTLEEIYQFCKRRQAEDAAAGCQDEAAEEDGNDTEEDKKEDEVVTDHAPIVPVSLGNKKPTTAAGTIGAMFAEIKNGGR